jgi:hypothetical protein
MATKTCTGSITDSNRDIVPCPCNRYVERDNQDPNSPHYCRDCNHFESCHPRQSEVQQVLDDILPKLHSVCNKRLASKETAVGEVNAGFREKQYDLTDGWDQMSRKETNQGGSTKFKVCCQVESDSRLPLINFRLCHVIV